MTMNKLLTVILQSSMGEQLSGKRLYLYNARTLVISAIKQAKYKSIVCMSAVKMAIRGLTCFNMFKMFPFMLRQKVSLV